MFDLGPRGTDGPSRKAECSDISKAAALSTGKQAQAAGIQPLCRVLHGTSGSLHRGWCLSGRGSEVQGGMSSADAARPT